MVEAVLIKVELLELLDNLGSIYLIIFFRFFRSRNEQVLFGVRKVSHVSSHIQGILVSL